MRMFNLLFTLRRYLLASYCVNMPLTSSPSNVQVLSMRSPVIDAYYALSQDPYSPLSEPSIPPLIISPELHHNSIVIQSTRSKYVLRLYGQVSDQSHISWDMNLESDDKVLCPHPFEKYKLTHFFQITRHNLSTFHPQFSLTVPGDSFLDHELMCYKMRLQLSHIMDAIYSVNDPLPHLAPDGTFYNKLLLTFTHCLIGTLIELEFPFYTTTNDGDTIVFKLDGPPVFEATQMCKNNGPRPMEMPSKRKGMFFCRLCLRTF